MAKTCCSVNQINEFIIENFLPYSWLGTPDGSGAYWLEGEDTNNVMRFVMAVRPNSYARDYMEADTFWRSGELVQDDIIPSTNSLNLPVSIKDSDFYIIIPMILGQRIIKDEKTLDDDSNLKNTYLRKTARRVVEELAKLEEPPTFSLNSIGRDDDYLKAIVFGRNFSKVKAFIANKPREEWTFIQEI
jgi:hypothetical protein